MSETLKLGDLEVRFELHGAGIPMVFTPGGFSSLDQARPLAQALAGIGYQVLLWDRPNTGGSSLAFERDDMFQLWADTLHALLEHTNHKPCFVAGGSAGSLTSLRLAHAQPEGIRGLIVIAPPNDAPQMWQGLAAETFLKRAAIAEEHGMAAALEAAGSVWDFFDWSDQFARAPHKRTQLLAMNPHEFAGRMRAWANMTMMGEHPERAGLNDAQLAAIKIPTIIFSGLDDVHPQHTAEALHARLPQSTLVISSEHYARTLPQIVQDMQQKGPQYFDLALVGRIDEFVQSRLRLQP
jgi:pimeloyl-ACP methyl ester carboxylesterase